MEVVSKIGVGDVCPSALFGFPQWIYPTRAISADWDEFRYNAEIFKALCSQLCTAEIGLVTRLKPSSPFSKITPFYFITSDGIRLLMKSIIPTELKLPQRPEEITTPSALAYIEEEANDLIRSLIGQIERANFLSQSLSIGVYDHFRDISESDTKKTKGKPLRAGYGLVSKPKRGKPPQRWDISPGEYTPKFLSDRKSPSTDEANCVKKSKMTRKPRKRNEEESIHPALLSPGTIAKYRKRDSNHYELPEVMEPGVLDK